MQTRNNSLKLILGGVFISAALTMVIGFTSAGLAHFQIISLFKREPEIVVKAGTD